VTAPSEPRAAKLAPPEEQVGHPMAADMGMLRRLLPFIGRRPGLLFALALGMTPVASGAALFQPLLKKAAVDATIVHHSADALMDAVWLFVLTIAVQFVASFAQVYSLQLAGQQILARLRSVTFAKIQRLHTSYFDRPRVGPVVPRVTNDVDALGELFASGAVMAVADLVMLAGIVGFMLFLDWRLSLVAFCALPPLALVVNLFRRFAREAFRSIRARIAQLNAYLAEQVQGAAVVQAFGREEECQREYAKINGAHRDANFRAIRFDALLYSVVESVSAVTVALVLWYGAVRAGVLSQEESVLYVGTVVAFYDYIQRFFVPIRDLSQKYTIIQSSLAAAERIFDVLDRKEEDAPAVDVPKGEAMPEETVLALEDVRFGYRAGQEVLHGVDLEVRRGEKIAIVGATGAGKTTVASLFLRLYDVSGGRVVAFGEDVRRQDRDALRSRFAVVAQDVFLFSGTVLGNVAIGDDDPDRARAEQALRRVGAWEAIERRPGGLDAKVDERGANFSAGERQLLAFARALYLDREVLILDEATASVDSETEARLQHAVEEVLEGRTAIIIAHRLSTIRRADRILVFHHGRIVEEGAHDALIAANGVYARLVRLQFAETEAAA
jgi:ATP-binding cassette subfamily B multidrug efflux pump